MCHCLILFINRAVVKTSRPPLREKIVCIMMLLPYWMKLFFLPCHTWTATVVWLKRCGISSSCILTNAG